MDSYRSALIPVDERNNEPLAVRNWGISPEIELTSEYNPGSCASPPLHYTFSCSPAGWINRHQQTVIEYLQEENCILKAQLRGKRLRLTDDQRRRLAVKGKALGRKILGEVANIVPPPTRSWLGTGN